MAGEKIPINRTLVGIIALACLGVAGYLYWFAAQDLFAQQDIVTGAFMRVGLLMLAFWLALPTKNRDAAWANVPPWLFVAVAVTIVLFATRPKVAIPLVLFFGMIGFVLRPRNKKRRPPRY
ncbi:hypothetical protein V6x_59750 [Gimesia chilikensis]|uniref:Uncharacterized protein n=1 Tax=Gimesia chilikensis TaxID=2605989 RepID=A0A517WLX0_9PLAN|nr:hypothetical protein [Gimesia chilikensis]QDU06224.1 hypothetical protein V6x_59750 [Gimesia chilikensis]